MSRQFHAEMMCTVRSIQVDPATHVARVDVDPFNATDMTGTLRACQRLDPDVREINVFAGDEPDTRYKLEAGEWTAWRLVWADEQ